MSSRSSPHLLFFPCYHSGGSGEFYRAVTLAKAVQRRWPSARIEFVLPGGADTRHDCPFPATFNEHHMDQAKRRLVHIAEITRRRPQLAIFIGSAATSTLRCCRQLGVRTVYYGFDERHAELAHKTEWLYLLDGHWQERLKLTESPFTVSQKLRSAIGRTRRLVFDTYFDETPFATSTLSDRVHALTEQPFALFVPGGGGFQIDGRPVGDVFFEAAERLHEATGIGALTLLGHLYPHQLPSGKTVALDQLPQPAFLHLMRRAAVVVCNAGDSLHQSLSCGAACITVRLGGNDQRNRIQKCVELGLVTSTVATPTHIAAAAHSLLRSGEIVRRREKIRALRLTNGIPLMLEEIRLLLLSLRASAIHSSSESNVGTVS